MRFSSYLSLMIKAALAVALTFISVTMLAGQEPVVRVEKAEKAEKVEKVHKIEREKHYSFCSGNNWSNGEKVSFNEVREMTVPASGTVAVDGGRNGGVKVTGSDRGDVFVRACVQTWGISDEEARALASGIQIGTSPIKATASTDEGWSVSYEVLVPRNTNLKLNAHNGGIAISSVEGTLSFETTNGGVSLKDVAGDVRGRTTNGGVNVVLLGNSWKGAGLDVQTSNGGVHLSMPDTYAANIETGTVNGGFKSDIASLSVEKDDQRGMRRPARINQALNGGGAPIRVITTNGGIKISSTDRSY